MAILLVCRQRFSREIASEIPKLGKNVSYGKTRWYPSREGARTHGPEFLVPENHLWREFSDRLLADATDCSKNLGDFGLVYVIHFTTSGPGM